MKKFLEKSPTKTFILRRKSTKNRDFDSIMIFTIYYSLSGNNEPIAGSVEQRIERIGYPRSYCQFQWPLEIYGETKEIMFYKDRKFTINLIRQLWTEMLNCENPYTQISEKEIAP
jgi:hypothetical protein